MHDGVVRIARRIVPRRLRNWLRSPLASARWAADATLLAVIGPSTLSLRPGLRLRCHPAAARVWRAAQMADPDQAAELDAFLAACRPDTRLFDLGAHFGIFSLAAAAAGGGAVSIAVDPSPAAVRLTLLHARLNGFESRLVGLEAAAGEAEGITPMLDVGVQADHYFILPEPGRPGADLLRVRIVTVDALAERFGPPTLLKIDVEGAEAAVLAGARRTLRGPAPPEVFLECHNQLVRERGGRPEAAIEELAGAGYRIFDLAGRPRDAAWALRAGLVRVVARRGTGASRPDAGLGPG